MRPSCFPARLAAILLVAAPLASAQGTSSYGVLREIGIVPTCLAFESDAGELYALGDTAGFTEGDRVFVEGGVTGVALCGNLVVNLLGQNRIHPAFAGTGKLVSRNPRRPLFAADGGGLYELDDAAGFGAGAELFVKGLVVPPLDPSNGATHRILVEVAARGFAGFGRLGLSGSTWVVETEAGLLQLESMGIAFGLPETYVFVEGRLDGTTTPPTLRDNTTQPALELVGSLFTSGSDLAFEADNLLFDDVFRLESYGSFQAGQRAFARGRGLSDYDPAEPRIAGLLRRSRIDEERSGCGQIVLDPTSGAPFFLSDGGRLTELADDGGFSTGVGVYVAGALDTQAAPPRFLHNYVKPCVELSGELQHTFHCTPSFIADGSVGAFGNVFLLENLGGYWVGDRFCVRGAVTVCTDACPYPCITGNTVSDCTQ